jgi:Lipoprotein signal peptidase
VFLKIWGILIPKGRMEEVPNVPKCVQSKEKEKARFGRGVLFLSALLVLADQISKAIVVRTMSLYESIPIVQDFFHFTLYY